VVLGAVTSERSILHFNFIKITVYHHTLLSKNISALTFHNHNDYDADILLY
jgi:hypothetical protein